MGSSPINLLVSELNEQIEQEKIVGSKCAKAVENETKYKLLEKQLKAIDKISLELSILTP